MSAYINNRFCPCPRCKARGLTGAAILVTLGVLFLMDNLSIHLQFDETWPVLLIVIGLFVYLGRTASTEGHIETARTAGPVPPPPAAGGQHGPEVNS